ncbi:hypothetical protein C8J57DRAFT_1262248 [Mycena rebaudengoi]|nr:hypothetical protein C8J57DRAFT_1262248 [Mycena rebaudengoi]
MASPRKKLGAGIDPEGKRMKQNTGILARAGCNIPLSPKQQKWLGQFVPPPRAPRHPDGSFAMRKKKELTARKARVDALIAARNTPSRGPPPIIFREVTTVVRPVVETVEERKKKERDERKVLERKQAASARAASVALIEARFAARRQPAPQLFKIDLCESPSSSTMHHPADLLPVPEDIFTEICAYADLDTRITLSLVCSATRKATRAGLYRHISVVSTGHLLVRTLAANRDLPPMVHSLEFGGAVRVYTRINSEEWHEVLEAMVHLKHLRVEQHVNVDAHTIDRIKFQLTSFTAGYAISRGWDKLVRSQLQIKTLVLYGWSTFLAGTPPAGFSSLQHVTASAATLATFMQHYRLTSVRLLMPRVGPDHEVPRELKARYSMLPAGIVKLRLLCTQFLALGGVGSWLQALQELTLEEADGSWKHHTGTLQRVALALTVETVPALSSLRLIALSTIYAGRREMIGAAMHERCDLCDLKTLLLCTLDDGCTRWSYWGGEGESIEVIDHCHDRITYFWLALRYHSRSDIQVPALSVASGWRNIGVACVRFHQRFALHAWFLGIKGRRLYTVLRKTWTGTFWEAKGLKSLGVRMQLGHYRQQACTYPIADDSFVVNDFRGAHEVALDYCGCRIPNWSRRNQLMRARLLPEGPSEATVFNLGLPPSIIHEMEHHYGGRLNRSLQAEISTSMVPEDWISWDRLTKGLEEWVAEEGVKLPREVLELPLPGFVGGVYLKCTYGVDEAMVYMGPDSVVRIPDDLVDVEFVEGQPLEDAWTAVRQRHADIEAVGQRETLLPFPTRVPVNQDNPAVPPREPVAIDEDIKHELRIRQDYKKQQYTDTRGLTQFTYYQDKIDATNQRILRLVTQKEIQREVRVRTHYQREKLVHGRGIVENQRYQAKIVATETRIRWLAEQGFRY